MRRPCLERGCPETTTGTRCPAHTRTFNQRRRPSTTQRGYGAGWQKYAKQRIAEQPWCSVCHATSDLTLDHANDTVMCRRCNSGRKYDGGGIQKP